jgi:predicted ArsR family transcriptional regulator
MGPFAMVSPGPLGPAPARFGPVRAGLTPARVRLLDHVSATPDCTADDAAAAFGQHPNTVREHLDALVADGYVVRSRTAGPGRGRPAWHYRINPERAEPDGRLREYRALAGALAAHIAAHSSDPRAEARQAGARWGRAMAESDGPPRSGGSEDAQLRIVQLLADLDFGPRVEGPGRMVLTTCPLLEVARAHPDVVCSVHEGMVAAAMEALGADPGHVALRPFAVPGGCLLTIAAEGAR